MTDRPTTMGKAKIRKISRGTAVAVLTVATLLLPAVAFAGDEVDAAGQFTDSSNERSPAVTAFPKYPSIARRDRIEGEAMVCFTIDAQGRVRRPSVRSSTHRIFEKPAMRAIRRSSFAPLAEGEKPSAVKTCRTYRFRLDPINARNEESKLPAEVSKPASADVAAGDPVD